MIAQAITCPVCDVEKNREGGLFGSEWAVACHIAGSISSGSRSHRSWAANQVPGIDLDQSVPRLAEALRRAVRLAIESSRNRHEEVAAGIRRGQSPRSITRGVGLSHATVVQYLFTAVGRELLTRSEIFFSIEESIASVVEEIAAGYGIRTSDDLRRLLNENEPAGLTIEQFRSFQEDALLYFALREAPRADLYESLCRLETFMHTYIKTELERAYGADWWRRGIPEGVRKDCVLAKEGDQEPQADAYCYTTFIHLRDIFDKQWAIFCRLLPKSLAGDKSKFLSELVRLNAVRNRIMHPVRGYRPTKRDLDFVKDFAARMFAEDSAQPA